MIVFFIIIIITNYNIELYTLSTVWLIFPEFRSKQI